MKQKPVLIPKPLGQRVFELTQSLQVLRDSLDGLRQGKRHQLIPLSGQLRALLTERSKNIPPLLLDVGAIVGDNLHFFASHGVSTSNPPLKAQLLFHFAGFPISLYREFSEQRETTFEEFLAQDVVSHEGKSYSANDLIDFFANKAGGAHYSRVLPKHLAQLVEMNVFGVAPLSNAMMQIGHATLRLGHRLIQRLVEFDLHLLVHIRSEPLSHPGFLMDSLYDGAPMRISLFIDPMHRLHFSIVGVSGLGTQVITDRIIDWAEPHHFIFRVRIGEDLFTELSIVTDGELTGQIRVPEPLVVVSDPLHYDTLYNRSHDPQGWQGLSFCLAEVAMFGSDQSPATRAEALVHFSEQVRKGDLRCVYFSSSSFGQAPPGTKEMRLSSTVIWNSEKIRQGLVPDPNDSKTSTAPAS